MNKKGFTLIELLAVIVILSSISLVVVASVSSSLGRRDEKECKEQVQLAKNAAKIYFSLNNKTTVKISTLMTENYFNNSNCADDVTKCCTSGVSKCDKLNGNCEVRFSDNKYKVYCNNKEVTNESTACK